MSPSQDRAMPESQASFDVRRLRDALGRFATGVSIVTSAAADGRYIGLTVNSFSSVSLDPPLVLWSLSSRSASLPCFKEASHFAIHVLSDRQRELAERFASNVRERFDGITVREGAGRTPLLDGCAARFNCKVVDIIEAGDHHIFLGEVVDLYDAEAESGSLLFYRGRLQTCPVDGGPKALAPA